MNLIIALDQRYEGTPDGRIWTPGLFAHTFWRRYLDVFDHVRVVARVREVPAPVPGWVRADGQGVSFVPFTYYRGPWQYLKRRRRIRADLRGVVGLSDSVILRVGSHVAGCLERELFRTGHPYGVEVVNDPYDAFSPGAIVHPLSPVFRWWFPRELRRQCSRACAAAYVTEHALQRRYPASSMVFTTTYSSVEMPDVAYVASTGAVFSTYFSDVELTETAFVPVYRHGCSAKSFFRLVAVGSLEHLYKAPDVLLEAIRRCVRDGIDLELVWIGGGKHQMQIEAQAQALGLGTRVKFPGQLPAGEAVREEMDRADVFVLPSRQEGLPRAMIEAMARALPCIGSTVGGIPELLPAEDLVPPGDHAALAAKIREVVSSPNRLARMSVRNLAKAQEYRDESLLKRRIEFYRYVRKATEAWVAGANGIVFLPSVDDQPERTEVE